MFRVRGPRRERCLQVIQDTFVNFVDFLKEHWARIGSVSTDNNLLQLYGFTLRISPMRYPTSRSMAANRTLPQAKHTARSSGCDGRRAVGQRTAASTGV